MLRGMLARERKAVSAIALAFWGLACLLIALFPDTGVQAFFGSLAALYGAAVFGLVAGYFWARWFARGLGWWGAGAGVMLMLGTGPGTFLIVFTLTHVAVILLLRGPAVAAYYDAREDWRHRFSLDDDAVEKIGGTVTNLGTLLPYAAFYAFFPRGGALAVAGLLLAAAGTVGILRMRSWGLLAVAAGGVTLLLSGPFAAGASCGGSGAIVVGSLLTLSVMRFAPHVVRWFRLPSR